MIIDENWFLTLINQWLSLVSNHNLSQLLSVTCLFYLDPPLPLPLDPLELLNFSACYFHVCNFPFIDQGWLPQKFYDKDEGISRSMTFESYKLYWTTVTPARVAKFTHWVISYKSWLSWPSLLLHAKRERETCYYRLHFRHLHGCTVWLDWDVVITPLVSTRITIQMRNIRVGGEKDEKLVLEMNIPCSVEDIIHKPTEEFQDILSRHSVSEEAMKVCRDIRRRGKNKVRPQ